MIRWMTSAEVEQCNTRVINKPYHKKVRIRIRCETLSYGVPYSLWSKTIIVFVGYSPTWLSGEPLNNSWSRYCSLDDLGWGQQMLNTQKSVISAVERNASHGQINQFEKFFSVNLIGDFAVWLLRNNRIPYSLRSKTIVFVGYIPTWLSGEPQNNSFWRKCSLDDLYNSGQRCPLLSGRVSLFVDVILCK